MKLIVGLGNPGKKYEKNRHNVGFMTADFLAGEYGITSYKLSEKGQSRYAWLETSPEKAEILKPQTFMNDSGAALGYVRKKHPDLKNYDVCVLHDDLDLPFGSYKLQFGRGPRQHNGLLSVEDVLGTKEFWRLRVGIENRGRKTGSAVSGEAYVLSDFTEIELKKLNDEVWPKAVLDLKIWLLKNDPA